MIYADLITILLIPLISIAGLVAGMILSYVAKEELSAGRRYFVLIYRIIFVILSLVMMYLLSFPLSIVFLLFAIILLIADLKMNHTSWFIVHYLFFLSGYFVAGTPLIIAAIIFLYGLPVGTLLRMKHE